MRKRGSEYQSCGCETHFLFEPFEIVEQELCRHHKNKVVKLGLDEKFES